MWVQKGLQTDTSVLCIQRHTQDEDEYTHMPTHSCTHVHQPNNYITLHPPNKNETEPNVIFLNKNAYRGLKRSVLRTKSLFCFNHVWVLLLLNTDTHLSGKWRHKNPMDASYIWEALNVANHMHVTAYVCLCVRTSVCLCAWISPYQYRL